MRNFDNNFSKFWHKVISYVVLLNSTNIRVGKNHWGPIQPAEDAPSLIIKIRPADAVPNRTVRIRPAEEVPPVEITPPAVAEQEEEEDAISIHASDNEFE